MGGAGGNLIGVPWGFREGGPCLVSPREKPSTYVSRWSCSRPQPRGPLGWG